MLDSPRDYDQVIVKSLSRAIQAIHYTLKKNEIENQRGKVARYTMFDRVGLWCTHLRTQLCHLGEKDPQLGLVIKTICDRKMWVDVAILRHRIHTMKSYLDTGGIQHNTVHLFHSNVWKHQVDTPGGTWHMDHTRLNHLLDQSKRAGEYTISVDQQSQNIARNLEGLENGPIQRAMELLEESKVINLEADIVVTGLCSVAEAMVD